MISGYNDIGIIRKKNKHNGYSLNITANIYCLSLHIVHGLKKMSIVHSFDNITHISLFALFWLCCCERYLCTWLKNYNTL